MCSLLLKELFKIIICVFNYDPLLIEANSDIMTSDINRMSMNMTSEIILWLTSQIVAADSD